jgi:haloalkane dehalogenase
VTNGHAGIDRRSFMRLAAGVVTAGAFAACAPAAMGRGTPPRARPLNKDMDARQFTAARKYSRTAFGNIAYVEKGAGDAALFLHGFPLNGFQWRGLLPRLAGSRRCIAPDFLGLGYTEVAAGQSLAPAAQADMLAAFMDTLGVTRADVVANDSGGAVAQLLAARHPGRVRSLLLTNCDTEFECPPAAMAPVIAMSREGSYVDAWLRPWLKDKTLARSAKGLGGMTFSYPEHPTDEAVDMYLAPLVANAERTHAYALALAENSLAGIGPRLAASRVPVRVVWGMADPIFPPSGADYLDHAFKRSQGVHRIANGKLFFPEEFPDLLAAQALHLWHASGNAEAQA